MHMSQRKKATVAYPHFVNSTGKWVYPDALPTEAAPERNEDDRQKAELAARAAEGKRFVETFGELGATWFAEGKTFDEAKASFAGIDERKAALQAIFADQAKEKRRAELTAAHGPGMARIIAGLEMPASN